MFKFLLVISFFSSFLDGVAAYANQSCRHKGACPPLATIMVTEKGLKAILEEQFNNTVFQEKTEKKLKEFIENQPELVLFKTKEGCKAVSSSVEVVQNKGNCELYPILRPDGSIKEWVPFQAKLNKFEMKDLKFSLDHLDCVNAQECMAQVSIENFVGRGQIVIERSDKPGEILESPYIEVRNQKNHKTLTSIPIQLKIDPNGKMIATCVNVNPIKIETKNLELQLKTTDNGRFLSKHYANKKQAQEAQKSRKELLPEYRKMSEVQFALKIEEMEASNNKYGFKSPSRREIKEVFKTWKSSNSDEYPPEFNYLPDFQKASQQGEAKAEGFSNSDTENAYKMFAQEFNQNILKKSQLDPIINKALDEKLEAINEQINNDLDLISGDLGRSLVQNFDLPIEDIKALIQLKTVENKIKSLQDGVALSKKEEIKKQFENQIKEFEERRKELSQKLKNSPVNKITAIPVFKKIEALNGKTMSGIQYYEEDCSPPTQMAEAKAPLTKKLTELNSDIGFELPKERLKWYLDEIYKNTDYICLNSSDPNCNDGYKVFFKEKPEIVNDKDNNQYRLKFKNVQIEGEHSAKMDMSFAMNFKQCSASSESYCLSFSDAKAENKSLTLKMNDFLSKISAKYKKTDKMLNDGITREINITEILPPAIKESFEYDGDPMKLPNGNILFPLNINKEGFRSLLGKNSFK